MTAATTRRALDRLLAAPAFWPLVALLLLLLLNAGSTDGFLELTWRDGRLHGALVDIVDRASPLLLVSLGMALVIATGGVDLSVGAVMAIAAAVAAGVAARPDGSIFAAVPPDLAVLAIPAGLAAAMLAGAGNGVLVAVCGVQPIVATLVLMVAGRGVAQLLTAGQIVVFDDPLLGSLGNGAVLGVPMPIVVAAGVALLVAALVRGTAVGLFLGAIGENPAAARACGVAGRSTVAAAYVACGLLAGIGGLLVASDIRAADANSCGLYLELDAILAVVIGGTALTGGRFSLLGAAVGALLIQTVTTTILTRGVAVEHTLIVKAAIVIVVCLLQAPRFRAAVRRGTAPRGAS